MRLVEVDQLFGHRRQLLPGVRRLAVRKQPREQHGRVRRARGAVMKPQRKGVAPHQRTVNRGKKGEQEGEDRKAGAAIKTLRSRYAPVWGTKSPVPSVVRL